MAKEIEQVAQFTGYGPKIKLDAKGHMHKSTDYHFDIEGIDQKVISSLIGWLGEGVLVVVDGGNGKAKFKIEGILLGCTPRVKTTSQGEQIKSTQLKVYKAAVEPDMSRQALRLLGDEVTLTIVPHQIKLEI